MLYHEVNLNTMSYDKLPLFFRTGLGYWIRWLLFPRVRRIRRVMVNIMRLRALHQQETGTNPTPDELITNNQEGND